MKKIITGGLVFACLLSLFACKKPAQTTAPAEYTSNTATQFQLQNKEKENNGEEYVNEEIPYESPSESYELVKAACFGNNQLVKEILEKDPSIINKESFFLQEETTHTPLSCALTGTYQEGYTPNHKEVVKTLITFGVDVNQPDPSGQDPEYCTPLQLAVRRNDLDIAKLLIDNGANVNLKVRVVESLDNGVKFTMGYCPSSLEIAEKKENAEMIKLLLEAGADKNIAEKDGKIILKQGQKGEYEEIVKLLKAAGAKE